MSTTFVGSQPVPGEAVPTGLKAFMQRHPVASYLVLMYAGLLLAYLPLLLSRHAFGILPIEFPFPVVLFNLPASLLGPVLAGAIMAYVVGGKPGRQEYRKSLFRFRVAPQWYLLPLLVVPALGVLGTAAVHGISFVEAFAGQAGGFLSGYLLNTLLLAVLINLWEESGQMAFLTPQVQRRYGAVAASLVVAPVWALMHLPALFVPEMGVGVGGPVSLEGIALGMAVLTAFALPVRFIATWLFNSARQSVVIVALFHAAMNATQSEMGKVFAGYNPFYLIGAFAVVSVVLIAVTRGKLGYEREQAAASSPIDTPHTAAIANA
ncbi:MAG TPA: CPBP family glutamic-type intramembrane protease [Chloroflexia bacterium]|nr:CPBP family glutamic-type intramembrane protease [Chloroflexia bacterium]